MENLVKVPASCLRQRWLSEEMEHVGEEEPGVFVQPEGWNALQWLDYQSSNDGVKVPVETSPSNLPAYWRLARRWEKKFGVPSPDALETARKTLILFDGVPTPSQVEELEKSYSTWTELKAGVTQLVERLSSSSEESEDLMDLGTWVFTNNNLEALKSLKESLEEREEESEEEEQPSPEGTAWRCLPIFSDYYEEYREETMERKKRERATKALSKEQFETLKTIGTGSRWTEVKEAFKKFYASKEEFPSYWRERTFSIYAARKNKFLAAGEQSWNYYCSRIKEGISGKELYRLLAGNDVLSPEDKKVLWEKWRTRK